MKRWMVWFALIALSVGAHANQIFFIGKYDRIGSLSGTGAGLNAVYLRWDTIDGNMPSDIETIVLKRDGVTLLEADPSGVMDAVKIRALYQGKAQARRLYETLNNLSKMDDPNCKDATLSNFPQKIIGCSQNPFWRYMASRSDFNVARANYRGYLDTTVDALGQPSFVYELFAKSGSSTVLLGRVTVERQVKRALRADDFRQLFRADCRSPEYALDDYTVALGWRDGGQNPTERLLNAMMIAGYDLYRTTAPVVRADDPKYVRDIASESAMLAHDSHGDVKFDTLEKVNESLITQGGNDGNATLYLETIDRLKAAGLKPSEARYYYLVPRDFSGNYGATARLLVTVPDLLPPPAPWDVRFVEAINFDVSTSKDANNSAELVWSSVNVANYTDHYHSSKRFCNLAILSAGERLTFVDEARACGSAEMSVNLNVKAYHLFRFESPYAAQNFQTDGCGDVNTSHLVATIPATEDALMTFKDKEAKVAKVYWYRIASVAYNGERNVTSPPSAPIRALIPDRTLPPKPKASLHVCDDRYVVYQSSEMTDTSGRVKSVRLECGGRPMYGSMKEIEHLKHARCVDGNQSGHLIFLDENDDIIASTEFGDNNGFEVVYECVDRDVRYGNVLTKWPTIRFDDPRKKHLELSLDYGDRRYTVTKAFNVTSEWKMAELNLANLGSGLFCPAVNEFNANNQYSPTLYLPCFSVLSDKAPNQPNITDMSFSGNAITVEWLPAQENVGATMLRLSKQDDPARTVTHLHPHPGHIADDGYLKASVDVNLTAEPQTWCVRAKSVGLNDKLSVWSALKCEDAKTTVHKNYLAWPKIPGVSQGGTLDVTYTDNLPHIRLDELSTDACSGESPCGCDVLKNLFRSVSNFVLYRQTIYPDGNTTFTQVSPLIETLECNPGDPFYSGNTHVLKNVKIRMTPVPSGIHGSFVEFFYLDRYPHVKEESYRYVMVYFDPKRHEPIRYSLTKPSVMKAQ